jgi:ferredoxin
MHKITVLPGTEVIEVESGSNLREVLINKGQSIKSPCGGCASCGQCVVVVKSGFEGLSEISFEEKQIIGNVFHITQERLSCQTTVMGDITVDISAHIEVEKKKPLVTKRRTRAQADTIIEERKENSKNRPEREGGFNKPKSFTTKDDKIEN